MRNTASTFKVYLKAIFFIIVVCIIVLLLFSKFQSFLVLTSVSGRDVSERTETLQEDRKLNLTDDTFSRRPSQCPLKSKRLVPVDWLGTRWRSLCVSACGCCEESLWCWLITQQRPLSLTAPIISQSARTPSCHSGLALPRSHRGG